MKLKPPRAWLTCKGVFVGGCIKRGEGSSFRAQAHAHNRRDDPYFGWICFRSARRIKGHFHPYDDKLVSLGVVNYQDFDGRIDTTNHILLHEYAHILSPNHGHDDTFRKRLRELGGRIEKRYK